MHYENPYFKEKNLFRTYLYQIYITISPNLQVHLSFHPSEFHSCPLDNDSEAQNANNKYFQQSLVVKKNHIGEVQILIWSESYNGSQLYLIFIVW